MDSNDANKKKTYSTSNKQKNVQEKLLLHTSSTPDQRQNTRTILGNKKDKMKNSKTTNATNTKYDILNKNNNKSKNYNNCTLKTNAKRLILKPPKVINKNPLITKYKKHIISILFSNQTRLIK